MWFISIYTLVEGHKLISKMKREISKAITVFKNSNIIGPYTVLFCLKFCFWTLNITSPTHTSLMLLVLIWLVLCMGFKKLRTLQVQKQYRTETVQKWNFLIPHAPNQHTAIPLPTPRDLLETTTNESLRNGPWELGLMQGLGREETFHICPPHIVKALPGHSELEFRTCP